VQDEEVCGERAEHDGREQRSSNSPRPRHHDQYGCGELEDARDEPKPPSKGNRWRARPSPASPSISPRRRWRTPAPGWGSGSSGWVCGCSRAPCVY